MVRKITSNSNKAALKGGVLNPAELDKNSIQKTDKNAFTSVVIPNSVENIKEKTFEGFTSITSIHIPNTVSNIGSIAFAYCSNLASIHIPNSIPTIYTWSFSKCTSLASVHIPNSVKSVHWGAFGECFLFHKAFLSTTTAINVTKQFLSFPSQTTILCPQIKPITFLQKKSACRVSKTNYSIYL